MHQDWLLFAMKGVGDQLMLDFQSCLPFSVLPVQAGTASYTTHIKHSLPTCAHSLRCALSAAVGLLILLSAPLVDTIGLGLALPRMPPPAALLLPTSPLPLRALVLLVLPNAAVLVLREGL